MTPSLALSRSASAAALAFVLALPAPALAQWQDIRVASAQNQVDRCSDPVLRAADNRALRLPAGGGMTIEVTGHGIDLTRDFSFDGGTVTWQGSYGGPANIRRGCGAIGSVKLHLAVSHANPPSAGTAERNFTLRIGDQAIRVTAILPTRFQTMGWHYASFRQYDGPLSPERPQVAPSPGGSPPPPSQGGFTVNSGVTCQQTQTCGGGGTTGFVFNQPSTVSGRGGTATDNEPLKSLAACILGKGGDIRVVARRLEIMLPDDRAAVRDCITAPSFAVTAQDYDRADILGLAVPDGPFITFSTSGGPEVVASPSLDRERAKFSLNRDFAMSLVGVRNFRLLATNFAQRTQALDVRVQSVVPYGVARIAPATTLAATGSLGAGRFDNAAPAGGSALNFDVELAPSDAAARPLRWELRDAQGQPAPSLAQCFTAISGTISPAAGVNRVTLSLARSAPGACAGRPLSLHVAPAGRFGHPLYTENLAITLR